MKDSPSNLEEGSGLVVPGSEGERLLARLAQVCPQPLVVLDLQGRCRYANPTAQAWARAAGVPPGELVPEALLAQARLGLAGGAAPLEQTVQSGLRTVAWSLSALPEVGLFCACGLDVSERAEVESQLRQLQRREAVGLLAPGVAHDFNNILTVVRGYADLLLTSPGLDQDTIECLEEVTQAVERGAGLTHRLLAFSGKHTRQPRVVEVNELLTGLAKMLGRVLGEDMDLRLELGPELPAVHGDPVLLEQALLNLALHARQVLPAGGRVVLRSASLPPKGELAAGAGLTAGAWRVKISLVGAPAGGGAGSAPSPGLTVVRTASVELGTALGLVVARGIAAEHGGWLETESGPGSELAAHIYLPASPDPRRAAGLSQPVCSSFGGKETILLVEDDECVRRLTTAVLVRSGYRVLEAADALRALEQWRFEHGEIDLLLSDIVLPGELNGTELATRLRAEKPSLKVLLTTGYLVDEQRHAALKNAGWTLLQKPYELRLLAEAVRQRLDESW